MSKRQHWEGSNPRCPDCGERHKMDGQGRIDTRCPLNPEETAPNWSYECEVCGATPVVPATGLCGPCTFGEAETAGGNW